MSFNGSAGSGSISGSLRRSARSKLAESSKLMQLYHRRKRQQEQVKFMFSKKATKFCEIFTLRLSYVVPVKSKVKILQNFVAFSEYMNFTKIVLTYCENADNLQKFWETPTWIDYVY